MRADLPVITVLGVDVAAISRATALDLLDGLLAAGEPSLIAFANAHSCNLAVRDGAYRTVLADAAVVLPDGSGLALAARVQGTAFPANLNGTDLTPALLAATTGRRVFLLGGRPGVADRAAAALRADGVTVVGTSHGYRDDDTAVVAEIAAARTEILLVGMGNPRQELWLARHLAETGAVLGVAVGAFLDFTAGEVRRAPAWMRRAGVEWLYRLLGEPRRLFTRYVVGNPQFVARVLVRRLRGRS